MNVMLDLDLENKRTEDVYRKFSQILCDYFMVVRSENINNESKHKLYILGSKSHILFDQKTGLTFISEDNHVDMSKNFTMKMKKLIIDGLVSQEHVMGFPPNLKFEEKLGLLLSALEIDFAEFIPGFKFTDTGGFQEIEKRLNKNIEPNGLVALSL